MRTFLVTGSSRGIGLGLVQQLLRLPESRVIATCRSPATSAELEGLRREHGDRLVVMMLDVTSEWSFEVLKGQLVERGIESVDVLIANAGVTGERDSFHECDQNNFNTVFSTNVFGPMFTYQNLSPLVVRSTTKLFVTMSSIMGSIARTGEGHPRRTGSYAVPKACASYRMSKATANMMSMILASDAEIREAGCKVLCIHPGWVQTDMGNAGGRTATFSVDECAQNVMDILQRTISIQESTQPSSTSPSSAISSSSSEPTPAHVFASSVASQSKSPSSSSSSTKEGGKKEFEEVLLAGSNCVFVNYDGSVIPW